MEKNMQIHMQRWHWKMNYCKSKYISPANKEAWQEAEGAWIDKRKEDEICK